MKTLSFDGKTFSAEKIFKEPNAVVGYDRNHEVFAFRGITDFSAFTLLDNQDFDLGEIEQLRLEIARSNAQIFEIMISMLGGGV